MAKRRTKRKRTTREWAVIIFSILIAISMIAGVFASFATPPPPGSSLPLHLVQPVVDLIQLI
jgi:hypothetical protein